MLGFQFDHQLPSGLPGRQWCLGLCTLHCSTTLKARVAYCGVTSVRGLSCGFPARLLHYFLPQRDVLFLHSGCNVGRAGDVTLFFGLSGAQQPAAACIARLPPALFA
jgi:hypothetical protein